MCLLLLALNRVSGRPWLLLGNRDEFHSRPSTRAQAWSDSPAIVGGRDVQAGGSWLAVNRNGRYAAVTNVRTGNYRAAALSRGALVAEFVAGTLPTSEYLAAVASRCDQYGPFNLIVGVGAQAGFVSSIDAIPRMLEDGIHAFSNGSPQDDWPKMHRLRASFSALLSGRENHVVSHPVSNSDSAEPERACDGLLLDLLLDTELQEDRDLPDTGIGLELERRLAPIFVKSMQIRGEAYGTRASTLAYACADGTIVLRERRFGSTGLEVGESAIEVPEL